MKLRTGAVLPHFLSADNSANSSGFNKQYKNNSLRVGTIIKTHALDENSNVSKTAVEYDVIVSEQDANKGSVHITYRNCLYQDGLGGIGDFFEKTLRSQKKKKTKKDGFDSAGQDGSQVLLLCLNGASDRAIIIGSLKHHDRKTKLTGKGPQMFGSFNGIDVQIETDGSCRLTFNGATDNDGKPLDAKQGVTTVDIEKDGSVQIKNAGVTQRLQKDGKVVLNAEDTMSISNKKTLTISSGEKKNVTLKADEGKLSVDAVSMALKASGSATMDFGSLKISSEGEALLKAQSINMEASSMVKVKSTMITLDGMVALGGDGGTPALTLQTQFLGVGNLGAPVLSQAIGPFSTKVTIV